MHFVRRFVCLGSALCLFSSALWGADWPQFLGPDRNGVSPEKGLLQSWPKSGPPVLWQKKVGEGFSGPVVAGNRLILFHRIDNDNVVECLDAATGQAKWQFKYPTKYDDTYQKGNGPRSTPLIADKHVYTLSAEGKLHCLELDTGKMVWNRSLNTEYGVKKGFFGVGTSPIMVAGRVLINVGGPEAGVVALDGKTGKEAWKATKHEASYSSPVAVTIGGVPHAIFMTREGILALDPASGKVRFSKRWRARIQASVNAATPMVVGDLLFVSSSYSTGAIVHRINKEGIQELWKGDNILSNHYNTSVHHHGYLYGIDGRQEGGARLRCVELKTGKVQWTKAGFGCASMILADGNLITLKESGELLLIEATPKAYREKARAQVLGSPCRAVMALANGRLYARGPQKLICWNLKKK